jgi:hypothetical protein
MNMKKFPLGNTLLIGELPDHLSSAEEQALFEQIEEWFSQRDREGNTAASARRMCSDIFQFEENLTLQTSKDN